jgi:hypothetical protein
MTRFVWPLALASALAAIGSVVAFAQAPSTPPSDGLELLTRQLVYPKKWGGDSAETTVENGRFSIPIEFLTQSRRPLLVGNLREKCDRRPETVVIMLVGSDPSQEYDRVSLDLRKDFKMADPTAYTLRSEIVLNGSQ